MVAEEVKQWVAGWVKNLFHERSNHQRVSAGVASAGMPIQLDHNGKIDPSFYDNISAGNISGDNISLGGSDPTILNTAKFTRNLPAASTSSAVVLIEQLHAGDDQAALAVTQAGSADIFQAWGTGGTPRLRVTQNSSLFRSDPGHNIWLDSGAAGGNTRIAAVNDAGNAVTQLNIQASPIQLDTTYVYINSGLDYNANTGQMIVADSNFRQLAISSIGISRRDADSEDASVWINFAGYLGGTTRYRALAVGNGKNAALLEVVGSTSKTMVHGPLHPRTTTGASGSHAGINNAVNTWTFAFGVAYGNLARTYLVGLTFVAGGQPIASSCIYAISMGYSTVACTKINEALFGHNSIVVTAGADTANNRLNIYINQTNPYGVACAVKASILSLCISDDAVQSYF